MKYDRAFFDAGAIRQGTRSVKWDEPECCLPGDIPLWVADWDFRCAQPIREALKRRAEMDCYGYPCADDNDQRAFCAYWKRRHGVAFAPEETAMMPSVVAGLRQAVLCFTEPNDGVILFTPVYHPFQDAVTRSGRRILATPLIRRSDAGYDLDFDALENHLRNGSRLILLCNPHNPVSRAWRREELERVVRLANACGAVLVSDEIHADFVYSPLRHVSILTVPDAEKCALLLASASKTFNVPGLQQSMAVSHRADLLDKIKANMDMQGVSSGNAFALDATQAAYTSCDDWLDSLRAYLEESRALLETELPRLLPRAVLAPIEATALCWIDLRAYGKSSAELFDLFRAHHVTLSQGTLFDETLGEGFMRLNFACPHAQLREGLRRMAEALEK